MDFEKLSNNGAAEMGKEELIVTATAVGFAAMMDGVLVMLALRLAKRKGAPIPRFGYLVCVFFAFVIGQVTATANISLDMRVRTMGRYIKEHV